MLSPCLLRLEFPDFLAEGTVTMLVGVLGYEIGDLVLCFHKVDGDLTLLHYFLYKEVPWRNVLRARAVCAVAGDVTCQCVLSM